MPEIAERYLEDLQRKQAASGRFPQRYFGSQPLDEVLLRQIVASTVPEDEPERAKEIERRVAKELEDHQNAASNLPTELQNPLSYSLLSDLFNQVQHVADRMGMGSPPAPVIGTLASGQVNGMAVKPPESSTHLILIEDGLFLFCHLMAKALAQGVPFTRPSESLYSFSLDLEGLTIEPGSPAFGRMMECLTAYLVSGDVTTAPAYLASSSAGTLAEIWRRGAELFVVGHEWAHVHRGHLDAERLTAFPIPGASVRMMVTQHAQEFEADHFGAAVAIQSQLEGGLDLALSYLGPRLFLTWLEITEELVSILRYGEVRQRALSPTHPPTPKRRESLDRTLLASLSRSVLNEGVDDAIDAALAMDVVLDQCAEHLRAEFRSLHEKGGRPHAIWGG